MHTRLVLGIITLLVGLLAWSAAGISASSINTTLPADGYPFAPAVIRGNFSAAANDINALQSLNSGATAPSNPTAGTFWLYTPPSGPLVYTLNIWDTSAWVPIAALDTVNHLWNAPIGGGVLATLLSAVTTDLGTVSSASLYISGANSIQSFGSTTPTGGIKVTLFTGAATLVQNGTSLILPGAANIVQQAGDVSIELALGGGRWQVIFDSRVLQSCSPSGGFSCTTINAKTSTYTAQPADCGNTIELGGNAFYALTINSAGSYLPNCQLTVINTDVTRGKQLVVTGSGTTILWPEQVFTYYSNGTSWNAPARPRWRLPVNTTFYVDPVNGTDNPAEDCLAPITSACQSIQNVINDIQGFVDLNGFSVTMSLAADTNPGDYKPFAVNGPWVGLTLDNNIIITGSTTAASSFLLDGQGAAFCISAANFAHLVVENMTVQNCNQLIGGGPTPANSHIILANVATGFCSGVNGAQIVAQDDMYVEIRGSYNIISSTNCAYHYEVYRLGGLRVNEQFTGTVVANITANLSYSGAFASASRSSTISFNGFSASPFVLGGNTVSGNQFQTEAGATIEVNVGGQFFPGNTGMPVNSLTYDTATYNPLEHKRSPTIASCGGGSPGFATDIPPTDYFGIIQEGTSVTSCEITFSTPFITAPYCVISPWNMATPPTNLSQLPQKADLIITHSSASGATITYQCHGG